MHAPLVGRALAFVLPYSGCGCHLKPSFPTDSAFNQISPVIPNQRMGMHPHCYVMTPDRLINRLSLKPTYIHTYSQPNYNELRHNSDRGPNDSTECCSGNQPTDCFLEFFSDHQSPLLLGIWTIIGAGFCALFRRLQKLILISSSLQC